MSYNFDQKEYREKINKKSSFPATILIFLIIILLGAAFFLQNKKEDYIYFHFVEVQNFLNYSEANKLSNEIQSRNGAGFIYYDGTYHVLANFYLNKSDASSVAENLSSEYPHAKVFTIKNKQYRFYRQNDDSKKIAEMLDCNQDLIKDLYSISIKLDKDEYDDRILKSTLSSLKDEYNSKSKSYISHFRSSKLQPTCEYIQDIQNSLENIIESPEIKKDIKYELIKIVIAHSSMLSFVA